ncbi:MAG: peptidylprolyl isomerase [Anaerolineales bacterium]|nr:peptidylprolyl isomerase [Anaerolineales bacterium]MCX7608545.1 peptidylprolyl isomerase [Anaerolineales bacterium]
MPLSQPTPTPLSMPCEVLPYTPPSQLVISTLPEENLHVLGPKDASVTILLFTDLQCPACALLATTLKQIREAHPTDVRLAVFYLPDNRFDKSRLAWQAAEAAGYQGKFWDMYDFLLARQADWYPLSPDSFRLWLEGQTETIGLDPAQFWMDFESESLAALLDDIERAVAGISYKPPLLFINSDIPYTGLADFASLDAVVRLTLLESKKFHTCPAWLISLERQYVVKLETTKGEIFLQLFPEKAPLAVNNFVFLARAGWYDGVPFHRVDAGFVAQTGDPSGTGYGNPGYYFATEFSPGLNFDRPGLVAMSNIGAHTNGSQFFITLAALPELNRQFTIFGEVLSGLEVVRRLSTGDVIVRVLVQEH